ncbi:transcriptional regulator [Sporosarcina sp. P12(2017)]|uniref:helix-turn-helix transcriptional regulator n=1 Tax=unclassified Sporosarcina TaxID=2647733 RepID=UPI000C166082|nr:MULTISPECIES: helix-turn-helix transcriptional regulator [unclassified Sporosarcina]PIC59068.1 transcriptional regulator [Sporosarcina sp. P10]PIC62389.1 transcriptional regulator [Sporosarcina sp. P12(2017)]
MRVWLKDKRLKAKLTQEQVAVKAGVARTTYAMYEQGERDPSVGVAVRIGDVLKFKWTLFFEDKVHETRNKSEVV